MNDIVERLRAVQRQYAWSSTGTPVQASVRDDPLSQEAADEIERLRADLGVLCIQRDDLMAMLRRVLDAGNAEAKAAMSYENARNNFSSSAVECRQYERAMEDASESERAARVLLMTLRVETVDAIIRGEQK
jgi:hypothetical protein